VLLDALTILLRDIRDFHRVVKPCSVAVGYKSSEGPCRFHLTVQLTTTKMV